MAVFLSLLTRLRLQQKNNHTKVTQHATQRPTRTAYATLWLCALIWGGAFVFQKMAMEYVGPFFFNTFRCLLSVITLLPFLVIASVQDDVDFDFFRPHELKLGLSLGVLLWLAMGAQQVGIVDASAVKATFINGLYIVFVPIVMKILFANTIASWQLSAVGLASLGLFLLSTNINTVSIESGDLWILLGTMVWAVHLCILSRYAKQCRALPIALLQMLTCAFLSGVSSWAAGETWAWQSTFLAIPSLAYTGILSGGIAFTLQIYGQRSVKSSEASIILSFEVAVGVLAGWYILREPFDLRSSIGAILILMTILVVEAIGYFQKKSK